MADAMIKAMQSITSLPHATDHIATLNDACRPHPHARAQCDGAQLPVAVLLREPKAPRRRGFGIELDQHRRRLTDHPGVMPRLHDEHLGRDEFKGTAIGIRATHVAPG